MLRFPVVVTGEKRPRSSEFIVLLLGGGLDLPGCPVPYGGLNLSLNTKSPTKAPDATCLENRVEVSGVRNVGKWAYSSDLYLSL